MQSGLSLARGMIRRVLAVNTVMLVVLYFSVGLLAGHLPNITSWLVFPSLAVSIYSVLDILTAWNRFRRVRFYLKGDSFMRAYFLYGISTAYLGAGVKIFKDAITELRTDKTLPAGIRQKCEDLIASGKLLEALKLEERAKKTAKRSAKLQARKQEVQESEAQILLRRGIEVGVPEEQMRVAIAESFSSARTLISRQEDLSRLTAAGERYDCKAFVANFIEQSALLQAEAVIARAKTLIQRSHPYGTEEAVRALIRVGNFEEAERTIGVAEKSRAYAMKRVELEGRIRCLTSPDRRSHAQKMFTALCGQEYGTRLYRQALHQLEEVISGN